MVAGADGTVYAAFANPMSQMSALDVDGTTKWSYAADSLLSAPALSASGDVIFAAGATLYSLASDGSLKWIRALNAKWNGSHPTLGPDGSIYVAALDTLYKFDKDGAPKWTMTLSSDAFGSQVAIGPNGLIYANTANGVLTAFTPDGTTQWSLATSPGSATTARPAVGSDGTIFLALGTTQLAAYTSGGQPLWTHGVDTGQGSPISIGPDDTVYYGGATLLALDPKTGSEKWHAPLPAPALAAPIPDGFGNVYLLTGGQLHAFEMGGMALWASATTSAMNDMIMGLDGRLFLGGDLHIEMRRIP
jgi:hypothetical protein